MARRLGLITHDTIIVRNIVFAACTRCAPWWHRGARSPCRRRRSSRSFGRPGKRSSNVPRRGALPRARPSGNSARRRRGMCDASTSRTETSPCHILADRATLRVRDWVDERKGKRRWNSGRQRSVSTSSRSRSGARSSMRLRTSRRRPAPRHRAVARSARLSRRRRSPSDECRRERNYEAQGASLPAVEQCWYFSSQRGRSARDANGNRTTVLTLRKCMTLGPPRRFLPSGSAVALISCLATASVTDPSQVTQLHALLARPATVRPRRNGMGSDATLNANRA